MFPSITWPRPDEVRSYKAIIMPRAHIKPPPAKSAKRLIGGNGQLPVCPRVERIPAEQNKNLIALGTK